MKQLPIKKNYVLPLYAACVMLTSSCMPPMSETIVNKDAGMNGGFEQIQKGLPINWLVYTAKTTGEGDFTVSADTAVFMEGNKSLKFDVTNCSDRGGRFSPGIATELEATAGQRFRINFSVKNNGAWFSARISGINATDGVKGPVISENSDHAEWKTFSAEYTIPEGMNKLRFEFNTLNPGTLWLDNVQIAPL